MNVDDKIWTGCLMPDTSNAHVVNMQLTEEDKHYLGGILDGEAGIWIGVSKDSTLRLDYRVEPKVEIGMKDTEETEVVKGLLAQACEDLDVTHTFRDQDGDGYAWYFKIQSRSSVLTFLRAFVGYTRAKRNDVETILDVNWEHRWMDEDDFLEIMETRDELRKNSNRDSKYSAEYFREEVFN